MTELQSSDRKLKQACIDLEERTNTITKLTDALRNLEEEKGHMNSEINMLEQQLQDEQENSDKKSSRMNKLEKDTRDLRVQLEQKLEMISDYEDQIQQREQDMDQQTQLVAELDSEVKRLQITQSQAQCESDDTSKHLQKVLYESKAKEEMIEDLKDSLRVTETLDERQLELQQRVSQVARLDQTIKEHHNEMEQRIQKLDSTLRKYEAEIQERTVQISDLDDRLQETQLQLKETKMLYHQTDTLAQKQQIELQSKTAKLDELEKLTDRQKLQIDELKDENVEITQELRLTREQLQQQHGEFMATRRMLSQTNRENEKITREYEEIANKQQSRETDTVRLAEELGAARAREKHNQAKISSEVDQMNGEINQIKARHQEEEQFEKLQDQLEEINNEMEAKKKVVNAANESLILKDAEIARLQARMSGFERSMTSFRAIESLNQTGVGNQSVFQSSGVDIVKRPLSGESLIQGDNTRNSAEFLRTYSDFIPSKDGPSSLHSFNNRLIENGHHHFQTEDKNVDNIPHMILPESSDENFHQSGKSGGHLGNLSDAELFSAHQGLQHSALISHQNQKTTSKHSMKKGKVQKTGRSSDHLPGEHIIDPETAVGKYHSDPIEYSEEESPEKCMHDLHERLRANEIRQQMIEEQLQSLDEECDTNSV
ncbi:unnamed protein product [Mytilus edulis]|uniref:Uncharacterized protein n=1 Tax=Mytilus edulis TaxID=6550 RepID=A0A8S3RYL1_MYTED|nr:unnamed protein product [Mytilus edulis]